jgi:cell division protein FtsL
MKRDGSEPDGGKRYRWIALGLTIATVLIGLVVRSFSLGTETATIRGNIQGTVEHNLRQDSQIKELCQTDKDLVAVDAMLDRAATNMLVKQEGMTEQIKAVNERLSRIETSQQQMSDKLDRLLLRP